MTEPSKDRGYGGDRIDGSRTSVPTVAAHPDDEERPLPRRGDIDGTGAAPDDWVAGPAPEVLYARAPDATGERHSHLARTERQSAADGGSERVPADTVEESSYSTERDQGAAQPGPTGNG